MKQEDDVVFPLDAEIEGLLHPKASSYTLKRFIYCIFVWAQGLWQNFRSPVGKLFIESIDTGADSIPFGWAGSLTGVYSFAVTFDQAVICRMLSACRQSPVIWLLLPG